LVTVSAVVPVDVLIVVPDGPAENLEVPFTCKLTRSPVKPEAALTPRPVPATAQAFVVVPKGSTSSCGLVVVVVPPVNHVPLTHSDGVEAAAFLLRCKPALIEVVPIPTLPLAVSVVKAPVLGVVEPIVPGVAHGTDPVGIVPAVVMLPDESIVNFATPLTW
jgi:hypothetical protein